MFANKMENSAHHVLLVVTGVLVFALQHTWVFLQYHSLTARMIQGSRFSVGLPSFFTHILWRITNTVTTLLVPGLFFFHIGT